MTQRSILARWKARLLVLMLIATVLACAWTAVSDSKDNPVKVLGCTWERIDQGTGTTTPECAP